MSCSFVGSVKLCLLFGSYSMAKGLPKGQRHDAIILMRVGPSAPGVQVSCPDALTRAVNLHAPKKTAAMTAASR